MNLAGDVPRICTSMSNDSRVPGGVPTGGQFQPQHRSESDASLGADQQPEILAASRIQGVSGGYTVTGLKQHRTYDGVAYVAKLRLDGKIVADLQQDGRGGQTWTRFRERADEDAFNALAAKWTGTWGGDYAFPHNSESVIEALVNEADLQKALAAKVRNGQTPVLLPENDIESGEFSHIRRATAEQVWARYPEALVWDGKEWAARP